MSTSVHNLSTLIDKPEYLYIPPVYEESTATISWKNSPGVDYYELDTVFDETFEAAEHGKTWADMELGDYDWIRLQTLGPAGDGLTWSAIEGLDAQGLMWRNLEFMDRRWGDWDNDPNTTWAWLQTHPCVFTVYAGPGRDVAAPDQGLPWQELDGRGHTWSAIALAGPNGDGRTWQEFEFLQRVGLTWGQLDSDTLSWTQFEQRYAAWSALEEERARGLTWGGLDARRLMWAEIGALSGDGLTWAALEHLPADDETQRGCDTTIPLYTKKSMFRLRAFDNAGNATDYITSQFIHHLPRSLKKETPPCLHIPEIREGRTARLIWGELYGASHYILERSLDGAAFTVLYDGTGNKVAAGAGYTCDVYDMRPPHFVQHFAFDDTVPYNKKRVVYRLKAYNTTDASRYRTSAEIKIIPVFERSDTYAFPVSKDAFYTVMLAGSDVPSFAHVYMAVVDRAGLLTLEDAAAHCDGVQLAPGDYKEAKLRILPASAGALSFESMISVPAGFKRDGMVTLLKFKARNSGTAQLVLS
ncbi:MAG: hypothetical protein LBV27_00260 [Oscillospiraceae bacterium]|nr:hypothetical protein [Oscillospiraceae bacterium]